MCINLKQTTENTTLEKHTISRKSHAVELLLRPLQNFLDNPSITEISINKPCEVWTKAKSRWKRYDVPELTDTCIQGLITALITYNGITPKSLMYLILPNGQRGTIAIPPAVIEGTLSFLIRKHSMTVKTLDELEDEGIFNNCMDVSFNKPSEEECKHMITLQNFKRLEPFEVNLLSLKRKKNIKQFLEQCVLNKQNIIISGKTGSGKTTFARSLIDIVPKHERIITIEDVHELFLENHANHVHMLYGSGMDRLTADECLASCMRQSPDRIFLAEIRGNEAWEYLNSLNTGHPGSITTVHANNALQTFERVATLIKKSDIGRQFDIKMIKIVLYTTVNVILFLQDRQLAEIYYDPIFSKNQYVIT